MDPIPQLSPTRVAQLAREVGCTVLDRQQLLDGGLAIRLECHTDENKVRLLEVLAEAEARELPDVRRIAEDVTGGARTDWQRAAMLQAFIQTEVDFVRELVETFSPSLRTLSLGLGDCDDHARLLLALLRSLAIPARLETIPPRSTPESPTHVAVQAWVDGRWEWLETTVEAHPGEAPLAAAERLGITTRGDLGAIGDTQDDGTLLQRSVEWVGWLGLPVAAGVLWWLSGK